MLLAVVVIGPALFGSPWHPISRKDLKRALDFCEAHAGERLVDLGSGDGRVLIAAAKEYGLLGTGIEIDPLKVWLSNFRVRRAGVQDRVNIVQADRLESATELRQRRRLPVPFRTSPDAAVSQPLGRYGWARQGD